MEILASEVSLDTLINTTGKYFPSIFKDVKTPKEYTSLLTTVLHKKTSRKCFRV